MMLRQGVKVYHVPLLNVGPERVVLTSIPTYSMSLDIQEEPSCLSSTPYTTPNISILYYPATSKEQDIVSSFLRP